MRAIYVILLLFFQWTILNTQSLTKQNSVLVETNLILSVSISYDRISPINDKVAIAYGGNYWMGVGFGSGSHWVSPELSLISFGPKHFLETGVLYLFNFKPDDESDENHSPGIKLGYRYQTKRGLSLHATANGLFNIDPILIPNLGIGYTF